MQEKPIENSARSGSMQARTSGLTKEREDQLHQLLYSNPVQTKKPTGIPKPTF
jgi:hypothetical protein